MLLAKVVISFGCYFLSAGSNMTDVEVSFDYLKSLANNTDVLLIDVREPSELLKTGSIPGSINIPLANLEKALRETTDEEFESMYGREKPKLETPLVFSCQSGRRSLAAIGIATGLEFKNVKHFPGGWSGWEKALKNES